MGGQKQNVTGGYGGDTSRYPKYMNWYMRRKSSRPFLMNWIKLSPRCLATKLSLHYLFSYYVLSIYIYHQLFLNPGHCSDLQASFSFFHFLHLNRNIFCCDNIFT